MVAVRHYQMVNDREILIYREAQKTQRIQDLDYIGDLDAPPVPGMYYITPCAIMKDTEEVYPILSHKSHADGAYSINYQHFHCDFRFILTEQHNAVLEAQKCLVGFSTFYCVREESHPEKEILYGLQRDYAGRPFKCNTCPHKGMYLGNVKPDENGNIVCNMHGLRINKKKGHVCANVA